MDFAPYIRIALRYIVGAGLMGSAQLGEMMATDPDLIIVLSGLVGVAVEAYYQWAKRRGGAT
jgi:hypothetical protein